MPYAPGVQYNGDRYWFAGLANLGRSIGDALQLREQRAYNEGLRRNERKQQEVDLAADEAKKAKVTRTFLSTWLPDQKDQFDSMGLAELTGTAQGLAERMADKDRAMRQEAQQLNIDAVRSAAERRGREENATRGFLSDMENFGELATAADGQPSLALSPELRTQLGRPGGVGLAALARNPDVPNELRSKVLDATLRPQSKGQWNLNPGQVIDFGNGSFGLAQTPNSVVVSMPKTVKAEKPKPLPAAMQAKLDVLRASRKSVVDQIGTVDEEISAGNRRPGPDFLPFATSYEDRKKSLQSRLTDIDAQIEQLRVDSGRAEGPKPESKEAAKDTADVDAEAERANAQAAIRRGASPAAVAARFKQRTGKDLF